jgi:hypothetical protein
MDHIADEETYKALQEIFRDHHKVHRIEDNVYVISSNEVWRPGAYESRDAAITALSFPDEVLQKLQDSVNPNGVITIEMLKNEKPTLSEKDVEILTSRFDAKKWNEDD